MILLKVMALSKKSKVGQFLLTRPGHCPIFGDLCTEPSKLVSNYPWLGSRANRRYLFSMVLGSFLGFVPSPIYPEVFTISWSKCFFRIEPLITLRVLNIDLSENDRIGFNNIIGEFSNALRFSFRPGAEVLEVQKLPGPGLVQVASSTEHRRRGAGYDYCTVQHAICYSHLVPT